MKGKGIALQLGEAGATVYLTGRTEEDLAIVSNEVRRRGGHPVPVVMDHGVDTDVEALFDRIKTEQNGKLDVCINNVYSGVGTIFRNQGKGFWETDPYADWDSINGVGLRGHYICTTYAARMMTQSKSGLIVIVSSIAGLK